MDKARAEAARVRKLNPERGDILFGWIEEREGRLDSAASIYQGVIKASADSVTRAMAEARLKVTHDKQQRAGQKKPDNEKSDQT